MIKNISSLQFHIKDKEKNKDKKFLKNTLIGGVVIVASTISFSGKNAYDFSKSVDVIQNHYSSIKDYNTFKTSFDNVVYTDEMFKNDLMTFKKLYVDNPYDIASKDYFLPLSEFMLVKFYTQNNQDKINDYVNKFKGVNVNNDNYLNIRDKKLNYLRKYKEGTSIIKEVKYRSDATFPTYLSKNFESYLKEKNVTNNLFYYSPSTKDYMNNYYKDDNKMGNLLNEKNKDFYELVNQVKSGDYSKLKEIFKVLNAYNIEIGDYNTNKYNRTFDFLDGKTLIYIENLRNLYTKNGSLDDTEEPEKGSKQEERYMSMW